MNRTVFQGAIAIATVFFIGLRSVVAAEATPKLYIESESKDFGKVRIGDVVRHEFVITNRGLGSLTVEEANKTCSCTIVLLSNVIRASESSTITLESRVDAPGKAEIHVDVTTNDPLQRTIALRLQFEGVRSLDVHYDKNALTNLYANKSLSLPFTFTSYKEEMPFKITKIATSAEWILPPEPHTFLGKSLPVHVLDFEFVPISQGVINENILIRTNCIEQPVIEIPLSMTVAGDYVVNPAELRLGNVIAGSTIKETFTVSRSDDMPYTISLLNSPDINLVENVVVADARTKTLQVEFIAPASQYSNQFIDKDCVMVLGDASGTKTYFILNITGYIVSK